MESGALKTNRDAKNGVGDWLNDIGDLDLENETSTDVSLARCVPDGETEALEAWLNQEPSSSACAPPPGTASIAPRQTVKQRHAAVQGEGSVPSSKKTGPPRLANGSEPQRPKADTSSDGSRGGKKKPKSRSSWPKLAGGVGVLALLVFGQILWRSRSIDSTPTKIQNLESPSPSSPVLPALASSAAKTRKTADESKGNDGGKSMEDESEPGVGGTGEEAEEYEDPPPIPTNQPENTPATNTTATNTSATNTSHTLTSEAMFPPLIPPSYIRQPPSSSNQTSLPPPPHKIKINQGPVYLSSSPQAPLSTPSDPKSHPSSSSGYRKPPATVEEEIFGNDGESGSGEEQDYEDPGGSIEEVEGLRRELEKEKAAHEAAKAKLKMTLLKRQLEKERQEHANIRKQLEELYNGGHKSDPSQPSNTGPLSPIFPSLPLKATDPLDLSPVKPSILLNTPPTYETIPSNLTKISKAILPPLIPVANSTNTSLSSPMRPNQTHPTTNTNETASESYPTTNTNETASESIIQSKSPLPPSHTPKNLTSTSSTIPDSLSSPRGPSIQPNVKSPLASNSTMNLSTTFNIQDKSSEFTIQPSNNPPSNYTANSTMTDSISAPYSLPARSENNSSTDINNVLNPPQTLKNTTSAVNSAGSVRANDSNPSSNTTTLTPLSLGNEILSSSVNNTVDVEVLEVGNLTVSEA